MLPRVRPSEIDRAAMTAVRATGGLLQGVRLNSTLMTFRSASNVPSFPNLFAFSSLTSSSSYTVASLVAGRPQTGAVEGDSFDDSCVPRNLAEMLQLRSRGLQLFRQEAGLEPFRRCFPVWDSANPLTFRQKLPLPALHSQEDDVSKWVQ
jgi:hypothetical protein